MLLFVHTAFMASFLWMVLHFWRQVPLAAGETAAGRIQEFLEWTLKGVWIPLMVWVLMNLGWIPGLPPLLAQVDVIKNAGGFWPWPMAVLLSPALSAVVSFWAALSLAMILAMLWQRSSDRADFRATALVWSAFMLPVSGVVILVGGGLAVGFAVTLWLAAVVHGTLAGPSTPARAPTYSQAIARIKFGKYAEAEREVIEELEQCENDFNGWMMLAELYAVHFNEFREAEQTIVQLCDHPGTSPSDVCVALHRLADWYLQLRNDPQGARRCMEAIRKRYPDTHLDRMARARLRRIPRTREDWLEENRVRPLHLPALQDEWDEPEALDAEQADRTLHEAESLSRKLAQDPNDAPAREEFARALARLNKLEQALEQIGLLLDMEGQMETRRAEWMALQATWMQRLDPDHPELKGLLRRLIGEFPNAPQAMAARRRLFQLDERARVAKYAGKGKKPRMVVRLDPGNDPGSAGAGRQD